MTIDREPGQIRSWFEQMLFRRAPQDDPFSYTALVTALSAYLGVDLLQAVGGAGWRAGLTLTAMDMLGLVAFAWAVLQVAGRPARLVQTLTALAGTGALLGLLGLPLALQAARAHQAGGEPAAATVFAWLALLAWSIAVQAHIYRHALSTRFGVGLMVAGLHIVLAINMLNMIISRTAGG